MAVTKRSTKTHWRSPLAGIGFELRKYLKRENFAGLIRGYGFAGLISSGPWIVSILGVMFIGTLSLKAGVPARRVQQFSVSVTYLMAASLILTGLLQLMFTRFVADRLFERKKQIVSANLLGALFVTTVVSALVGGVIILIYFSDSIAYRLLMWVSFVTLCDLWIVVVLLSGLKAYRMVLGILFIGYLLSVGAALALSRYGLEGLLCGFWFAQATMLFLMLGLIVRNYPPDRMVAFDFLRRKQSFYSLLFTGLFNNVAIWADKFLFWYNPMTSDPVIGPLRSSLIYDLPIFLAYLSIIPGMGVFLVRMETDFAENYDLFYDAVREGDSLRRIFFLKDRMVFSIRQGIYEIFKVQGLTVLGLLLAGPRLLAFIGISPLYLQLYYVDLVGVGVQVVLLGVFNALFYLDLRRIALGLNILFAILNFVLTIITQMLGAPFYGYGFAISVLLTTFAGLTILSRKLDRLEYETFMLQH